MKSNRPLPASNRRPADLLAELRQQIAASSVCRDCGGSTILVPEQLYKIVQLRTSHRRRSIASLMDIRVDLKTDSVELVATARRSTAGHLHTDHPVRCLKLGTLKPQ